VHHVTFHQLTGYTFILAMWVLGYVFDDCTYWTGLNCKQAETVKLCETLYSQIRRVGVMMFY